jgi:preprotein translocase subunit SecG
MKMSVFPLLALSFLMTVVAVLFIICALALILIILIQKGKGGGLTGALGGGMASGILGTKTGDFLTWVTIILVGLFLTLAVVMAKCYKPSVSDFGADQPRQSALPTERQPDSEQPSPLGEETPK